MEILHRQDNNDHVRIFHEVSFHDRRILHACTSSGIVWFNYQRHILCSISTSSGALVRVTIYQELTLLWSDWCSISTFFFYYKITERNRLIESFDNVASKIVCNAVVKESETWTNWTLETVSKFGCIRVTWYPTDWNDEFFYWSVEYSRI